MTELHASAPPSLSPAVAAASRHRSRSSRLLSIVTPMHNEEEMLPIFFPTLFAVTDALGVNVEVICVDDGSRDFTRRDLIEWAGRDSRVKIVVLARNFGKEAAMTAGLQAARGDMIVPIDADLQDPPELIEEFIRQWEMGADVVYGVRAARDSDTWLKRSSAVAFYRLFNGIADVPIPADTGDFRLMDRCVVDALNQLPERNRFMKGLFAWVGFNQVAVSYSRPQRAAGQTSWRYGALFRFAVDGITSFTTLPLRIWTVLGAVIAALAILGAAVLVIFTLVHGRSAPGYASLMVVLLVSMALQLCAMGIMGEYVGRLYQEVKARPIFIVKETVGFN